MSFPTYPGYKSSGVDWLGTVPEPWHVRRVGHVATIISGFPFDSDLFDSAEGIPLVRIRDLNTSRTETRYRGPSIETAAITREDVLIGMDGDFNVGRWLGEGYALLNQRMCCIRSTRHVTRFLEYALPFPLNRINDVAHSTTVKHLSSGQIREIRVALPPSRGEVEAILSFLDRETAKIDALVAEQERLIALLKEKRQAVITEAVTKGLDPSVPMKDSGVEWLGEVPAHWEVKRVKHVARLESGHTPSKQFPEYWEQGDIEWVSLNDSKQLASSDYIADTAVKITRLGLENSSARLLSAGSVVFTRDATIGLACITVGQMAVSQHLIAWCPYEDILALYLLRVFNVMKPFLDAYTFGATIKTIGMADIRKLVTPVPPINEQRIILDFVEPEMNRVDALLSDTHQAITLLKERRSALISAAVTGKIDVRNLVPESLEAA